MQQGRFTSIPRVTSLLGAFFATSMLAGVVGAGLAIPSVALVGQTAKATVGIYDALPDDFKQVVPDQQSEILASDGKTVLASLSNENRTIVAGNQIAPIMRKAQVAIEDKRFFEHGAIDPHGIGAAIGSALAGDARGASTLTQQYVKVTLQTAARARGDNDAAKAAAEISAARKLQEMKYAVEVEKVMSKEQILTNYLNLVYFGDQAYGVEAAARHYFSIRASQLTIPQAALLAGLVQNPGTTDPVHSPKRALARRNVVLGAMKAEKVITPAEYDAAVKTPLALKVSYPKASCSVSPYPFYCEYVLKWLEEQPVFGRTPGERRGNVLRGGYRIVTSLNPNVQDAAQEALNRIVTPEDYSPNPADRKPYGAAAVTLDTNSGRVLTMVQSTRFSNNPGPGSSAVNWAADYRYGASGGFPAGSTMKLGTLVAAMESGMTPSSVITDIRRAPAKWYPRDFKDGCRPGAVWNVNNVEGDANTSSMGMGLATATSVNTAFAALSHRVGVCKVRDALLRLGVHNSTMSTKNVGGLETNSLGDGKPLSTIPSDLVLGSADVSPMTMAAAYAVIANGGLYCPPVPVVSISGPNGKPVNLNLPGCKRVISKEVASNVASLLIAVMTSGTGKDVQLSRQSAGKTGTAEMDDTWFDGVTRQLSTAAWVGTPDTSSIKLNRARINGRYYGQLKGAMAAGSVWRGVMNATNDVLNLPVQRLDASASAPIGGGGTDATEGDGPVTTIPKVSGQSVATATARLEAAGFKVVVGRTVSSNVRSGRVAWAYPSGSAKQGSTISLRISGGPGGGTSSSSSSSSSSKSSSSRSTSSAQATPRATATP